MQVEICLVSFIIAILYCSVKSSSLPFSARQSPDVNCVRALLFLSELQLLLIFIFQKIEADANGSRKTLPCDHVHIRQIAYIEYLWYNILN